MKINDCNINMSHDSSFAINRPNGSGDNLFIYTHTPVILVSDGKMNRYPPGTTVFFRKGMPQNFMAAGSTYANAYVHFDADEEELAFIDSLGIPSGVPFINLDSSVFLNIHRYIFIEHQSQTEHSALSSDLLLKYFLIKLAQSIKESASIPVSGSTRTAMHDLRSEIYANAEKDYSIKTLAQRVGLSESYFQAIYKKMFGQSCINDIIVARINRARTLLMTTDLPISSVARMCGYESDSHFARQFKKITGVTAGEFRNGKNQGEENIKP